MPTRNPASTIGVFDSGVGGLSVLRAIWDQLPGETYIYVADQAHVPYGMKPLEVVRMYAQGITRYLLRQGVDVIVVACNTASAAALNYLRQLFPNTAFVGMEPAVKPAAETTTTGVVGVLATHATFQGALYASVVERFASGVRLLQNTCPGLVSQIENGNLYTAETRAILESTLLPMLEENIDTIVLGCTHYAFVIPLIKEIAGSGVRVIDPAPAIARQVGRMLGLVENNPYLDYAQQFTGFDPYAHTRFLTSADPVAFKSRLPRFIGQEVQTGHLDWISGDLIEVS